MSEFTIRDWTQADYELVKPWWERWGAPPTRSMLSEIGVVAEHQKRPAAAIFLFPAEGGYCVITYGISDFDLPVPIREEAVCRVTEAAFARARSLGMRNVRLYVAMRGYIRALEARGLQPKGPQRSSVFVSPVYLPLLGEENA